MAFGIDTFRIHIDTVPTAPWDAFRTWNGAQVQGGTLTGGDPVFAGRHLLGGDFIWGCSEATNSSSEPDGHAFPLPAGDPSPEHPENLTLRVPLIAPIQAPQPAQAPRPANQALAGEEGVLRGQIDADAICRRLRAALATQEFSIQSSGLVDVWLAVDAGSNFTLDYWAGWADTVNTFPINRQFTPFRACILCSYVAGAGGRLQPEPHVAAVLAAAAVPGMDTSVHALWADAIIWNDAPEDLLAHGDPQFDFNRFVPATAPAIWRIAHSFLRAGVHVDVPFDIDGLNPTKTAPNHMLQVGQWQPNVPTLGLIGFSSGAAITDPAVNCFQRTDQAAMDDSNFRPNTGHFRVPGGRVSVIGRYIRHGGAASMNAVEAQRISDANIEVFTVWESGRPLAGMGFSSPSMLDTSTHPIITWGPFGAQTHKFIHYFNPAGNAGTLDGQEAFDFCANVLNQPPLTPVFFAVDFDPFDLPTPDPSTLVWPPPGTPPPPAPQPPQPPDFPVGWPPYPNMATRRQWITTYFERVRAARDAHAAQTGRYYLIGVYCSGGVLQLLYEQGFCSHFWQAASSGHTGSRPPRWPWYHANRWQYQGNRPLFCGINGTDPDADWGDGGTWNLNDRLTQALRRFEIAQLNQFVRRLFPILGNIQDLLGGEPQ